MPAESDHFYGGQAVLEGVMMRGKDTWALAVRRPTNEIYLETNAIKGLAVRYPIFKKPFLRGIAALVEALQIGIKALSISANQALEEEEQLTSKQMGLSMGFALVMFIGIFIVLPAVGVSFIQKRTTDSTLIRNLIEGAVRIGVFLGYLVAISFVKDIRRVFMYHGAEHKTIAAYEAGEKLLEPRAVDKYSTLHVRCGTNFLIIVMLLTVLVFTVLDIALQKPPLPIRIVERILAIPLIAGISYEGLRLGAKRGENLIVRGLMKPGLWLQLITTKPPTEDQIEVAIRAFEAVLPDEERAIVAPLPSPTVRREDASSPPE